MSIGVAIIGSGMFAKDEHLPAVQAAPSLTLKAIYSRSLKSAKSLAENLSNADLYSDDSGEGKSYSDLLARSDIQAVIIGLPILTQPTYIRQALEASKHVLAEKPVAKDVATATELVKWYHDNVDTSKVTWSVAENFRFMDSFLHGAEQVRQMGRVLGFRTRMHAFVKPGTKYFETAWRKTPEYQGGFLLDGGVHFIAGTRLLLQPENAPTRVSAFTARLQEHLPPVDTVDATWKTKSGVSGTFSVSFGTTFSGSEYTLACEKGTVTVLRSMVKIVKDGKEETKEFSGEGAGVKQEVKAWGEGIESGNQDPRQTPEEALKDLEVLEAMLQSGEGNGVPIDLKH
ncbi:hypothetical protein W97_09025 [Coniosporium apollinis CBS 100218]|uniref:Gfo/Idh/MocA-like oxidoreductase N-terminal domain-containing protein n=1 Tax=Coniosporium apollinis (strain CBS 100218) TaxID=1168221 RepID=R7Z6G5_CONA1|nr:uncharacterized protein W97_09025 [Coniosporium apollinis CBS 100218]EON69762.1 hypothetical protein W97_09025 [Coniosporium apollinis CBS 100218]